ncbi:MAG TPA: hypothetical protein VGO22_21800 [Pseudorhizobium sp.]|nr:hypothetical protein [Pseudorhizobium sp.]
MFLLEILRRAIKPAASAKCEYGIIVPNAPEPVMNGPFIFVRRANHQDRELAASSLSEGQGVQAKEVLQQDFAQKWLPIG